MTQTLDVTYFRLGQRDVDDHTWLARATNSRGKGICPTLVLDLVDLSAPLPSSFIGLVLSCYQTMVKGKSWTMEIQAPEGVYEQLHTMQLHKLKRQGLSLTRSAASVAETSV